MSDTRQQSALSGLVEEINSVQARLQRSISRLVRARTELSSVRDLTQFYFRETRPALVISGLDIELLDEGLSRIHELSSKTSQRSSYLDTLKLIKKRVSELEIQYEFSFSENRRDEVPQERVIERSREEGVIVGTLEKISPYFGNAYTQILLDLGDKNRVSYRGVAHEIRELLRGVLNHFAPDEAVEAQDGFKLEQNQSKPTQVQKMQFILSSRNQSSAQVEPATKAVRYIDVQTEILSSMPRAIYKAGSDSAHSDPKNLENEVRSLKRYLDANLCDILEIN